MSSPRTPAPSDARLQEELAACAFSAVPGMGPVALAKLAGRFGSLRAAAAAGPSRLLALADEGELRLDARARSWLRQGRDLASLGKRALRGAHACGARVVLLQGGDYPARLAAIAAPPPLLYVRGRLAAGGPRVAVVGSRRAPDNDLVFARALARDLALAGVEVVSGGARGVDGAAHRGALSVRGATTAVLGCGIDRVYPPEHGSLFEKIVQAGGALVSEFSPGTPGHRSNFPRRNRTLSGLSDAVVVVRASIDSGALLTAREARKQGRPVFAVPGDRDDPLAAGPRLLLEEGCAAPVQTANDVLRRLGWKPNAAGRHPTTADGPDGPPHGGRPTGLRAAPEGAAGRLFALLDERRALHLDELAERSGVPAQEALRRLQELELKGLCFQRPGKFYLRRRAL